jgi:hypothetical protein
MFVYVRLDEKLGMHNNARIFLHQKFHNPENYGKPIYQTFHKKI